MSDVLEVGEPKWMMQQIKMKFFGWIIIGLWSVLGARAEVDTEMGQYFRDIRSAMISGDVAMALSLADKAIGRFPHRPEAWVIRSRIYENRREFDKAMLDALKASELAPDLADVFQLLGELHFQLAQPLASVKAFDRYLQLRPQEVPYHWQRGISLYYAGLFQAGADQFDRHKSVNGTDVENVFWHYLCMARATNPETAGERLLELKPGDHRIPMAQIYGLLTGINTADDIIKSAESNPSDSVRIRNNQLCYAHLYIGLFHEAHGQKEEAIRHLRLAATDYKQTHYMGGVARVHYLLLQKSMNPIPPKAPINESGEETDKEKRP